MKRAIVLAVVCVTCLLLLLVAGSGPAHATTTADEVHRLRVEEEDLDAAIALAQQYLRGNPELDVERQRVHYELGAALYASKNYTAAAETFREVVSDYAVTALDKTADEFVVDDAQFYVGVIEHYFGDRAKGISEYGKLVNDFPESNRRAQTLLLLAGVHEQDGDGAKAMARFKQLVQEHPQSEQAPEAQLHVGHLLRADGKLTEAIAAFERVAKDWPESKHAPSGLLNANRGLMEEELTSAETSRNEEQIRENEAAIKANVQLLLEKYADSDEIAQAMQDMLNYYSNPAHFLYDKEAREKVKAIVAWLRANRPETRQAMRAVCEYAIFRGVPAEDPEQALFELNHVIDVARESGDDSLLFDARFNKAHLLKMMGETDKARTIWTELLELASDEHLADEVRIMLIMLDPIGERLEEYAAFAADESRHIDNRSTALLFLAVDHYSEDRFEEALAIVDRIIAEFSEGGSVRGAEELRGHLVRLVKVPIENRGNYEER
jgi:TolA-binding protein